MNQMIIKIIDVEVNSAMTKTNKPYEFLEVAYKNMSFQEKAETKKVMPFGSKEVLDVLKKATKGEVYTILREKDDAGYWQWIGISSGEVQMETTQQAAAPAKAVAAGTPTKSTFETPDERAKKQVYIIRQSSLGHAIDTLKTDKKNPTPEEVIPIAQLYVDWVLGNNLDADPTGPDLMEDVPM